MRCRDQLVPHDPGPGELLQVGAAVAVTEDPLVAPRVVAHADVAGDDPARRLVRVGVSGPFCRPVPQVVIQRGEDSLDTTLR